MKLKIFAIVGVVFTLLIAGIVLMPVISKAQSGGVQSVGTVTLTTTVINDNTK